MVQRAARAAVARTMREAGSKPARSAAGRMTSEDDGEGDASEPEVDVEHSATTARVEAAEEEALEQDDERGEGDEEAVELGGGGPPRGGVQSWVKVFSSGESRRLPSLSSVSASFGGLLQEAGGTVFEGEGLGGGAALGAHLSPGAGEDFDHAGIVVEVWPAKAASWVSMKTRHQGVFHGLGVGIASEATLAHQVLGIA